MEGGVGKAGEVTPWRALVSDFTHRHEKRWKELESNMTSFALGGIKNLKNKTPLGTRRARIGHGSLEDTVIEQKDFNNRDEKGGGDFRNI